MDSVTTRQRPSSSLSLTIRAEFTDKPGPVRRFATTAEGLSTLSVHVETIRPATGAAPDGLFKRDKSPCCQMNTIRISQAQHQSPAEEVVGDCHRDFVVARFQRQRKGAILQRT